MTRESPLRERQYFEKDAMILREGDRGHKAYLIQSGSVLVYTKDEDDEIVELSKLGAGQIIGEMTLVFEGARTASVKALSDCNLIVITRETFNKKLESSDPTVRAIIGMLTERVSQANHALVRQDAKIEDVGRKTRAIFKSAMANLPQDLHSGFKQAVLPKLDDLFEAIKPFGKAYQVRASTKKDDSAG